MKFEPHGPNELKLCHDDGTPTLITIVDARDEENFFFVFSGDAARGSAETLEEAKVLALQLLTIPNAPAPGE